MIVGVINVGVMTVGVLSVGVMALSHFNLSFSFHFIPIWGFFLLKCLLICYVYIINMIYYFVHEKKNLLLIILHNQCKQVIKNRSSCLQCLILTLNFDMLWIFLHIDKVTLFGKFSNSCNRQHCIWIYLHSEVT